MAEIEDSYIEGFERLPEYDLRVIPEEAPIPFIPVQIGFGKLEIKMQNVNQ